MPAKFHVPRGAIVSFTGAGALVSWMVAWAEALPRLAAGPLCTSRTDAWSLAGHCPACFVAVAFSLLFLGSATAMPLGRARETD